VTPVPHADPEAVKPPGGRFPSGATVRLLDRVSPLVADLGEIAVEMLDPVPRWGHLEAGADPLEEPGVAFGPQEHTEQLAPDPGVIDEAPPDPHQTDPLPGAPRQGRVRQKA